MKPNQCVRLIITWEVNYWSRILIKFKDFSYFYDWSENVPTRFESRSDHTANRLCKQWSFEKPRVYRKTKFHERYIFEKMSIYAKNFFNNQQCHFNRFWDISIGIGDVNIVSYDMTPLLIFTVLSRTLCTALYRVLMTWCLGDVSRPPSQSS